jgi:dihydrofolate synthase / folylpolyglutamate synthase
MKARLAERLGALTSRARFGMDLGLDRMTATLALLGNPEEGLAVAHVAGTNGKGSTSAMVEAIARAAGLRTGLYTSPHLCRFAERIALDGEPVDDERLERALGVVLDDGPPDLTFFEAMTAAAFVAFRDAGVDLAVLEVGLGGRLDATNVVRAPLVTAITSIGLDHTAVLGGTIDAIAREKAGILKTGAPVVLGPLDETAEEAIRTVAGVRGAGPIWKVSLESRASASGSVARRGDLIDGVIAVRDLGGRVEIASSLGVVTTDLALRGPHQAGNAAVASGVAWLLGARWPAIRGALAPGLAGVRWPGRMERIARGKVTVLLDCAHNPDGARALAAALRAEGALPARTALVFGALADKAWAPMLATLGPLAGRRYYTLPKGRQPASLDDLRAVAPGEAVEAPEQAVARAVRESPPGGTVIVTGSSYLVGEIRAALLGIAADPMIPL